jgi:hypothetical protein
MQILEFSSKPSPLSRALYIVTAMLCPTLLRVLRAPVTLSAATTPENAGASSARMFRRMVDGRDKATKSQQTKAEKESAYGTDKRSCRKDSDNEKGIWDEEQEGARSDRYEESV